MKWVYLLWSVVLLGGLALLFSIVSSNSLGKISPAFELAVITWIVICIVSPVILILRLLRTIRNASSFIYVLMGTANLAIGIIGLSYIIPAKNALTDSIILLVLFLNVLMGAFVYVDIFIKTLPGFTKKQS